MRTVVERKRVAARARVVAWFLVAALVTPFVITGVFRLLPSVSTASPFVTALAVAAVIFLAAPSARPIAVGIAVGAGAHAVALLYLFSSFNP